MNNDLVSIITPSYNCAKYLPDCIHSVLAQTYPYWELLIVDDCSTDDTEALVKSYEDNRIFYYRNDVNQGAAYSRNLALREARGRWIAFLDSDDMWMPQKLEHQISFMEKNGYPCSSRITSNLAPNSVGALTLPLTIGRIHGWDRLTMRCSTPCTWLSHIYFCCS